MLAVKELNVLPLVDVPLLRKVLSHIDAHPEEYNQRHFIADLPCGTTYCIAGHILMMSGGTDWHYPGEYAMDRLGITRDEAFGEVDEKDHRQLGLFNEDSTRQDIQEVAERIAERAGEKL